MDPMQDKSNEMTYQGNLGNYSLENCPESSGAHRQIVDKSPFRIRNMENTPYNYGTSIWDNDDDEGTADMLSFFGFRESPEPPVSEMSNADFTEAGKRVQEALQKLNINPGTSTGDPNAFQPEPSASTASAADPQNIGLAQASGAAQWHNAAAVPLTSIYSRPMEIEISDDSFLYVPRAENDAFDMAKISKIFEIDTAAFNPNYEQSGSKSDEERNQPRFVLRSRADLREFVSYILAMHNLEERDMMFNVEISALMLHTVLTARKRKSYVLKIIKALLMNDTRRVFRLVNFRQGFEANVTEYKYMSPSEDEEGGSTTQEDMN